MPQLLESHSCYYPDACGRAHTITWNDFDSPKKRYGDYAWGVVFSALSLASIYDCWPINNFPNIAELFGALIFAVVAFIAFYGARSLSFETQTVVTYDTPSGLEPNLQAICSQLMPLFDGLPEPRVTIRDASHFNCHYTPRPPRAHASGYTSICFNAEYFLKLDSKELVQIMRHELVHCWMHWKNLDESDSFNHGPIFQRKAREVGGWW